LAELNSATEERFHVEWIAELSSGVERLGNRGVGAVVLDLTSPDSHGVETQQAIPGLVSRACFDPN
jgi:DNA-binding response OmpR family regulator